MHAMVQLAQRYNSQWWKMRLCELAVIRLGIAVGSIGKPHGDIVASVASRKLIRQETAVC